MQAGAQLKIRGVYQQGRDNDGELSGTYLGWNSTLGKAISIVPQGLYLMEWDGTALSTPEKDPAVNPDDFFQRTGAWSGVFTDDEKAAWANDFNLMSGNSGAGIKDGIITTVHSRAGEDVTENERFAVRKWDAATGALLSGRNDYLPDSMCLESAGMCVNPKDGKMYGLFYLTAQNLPDEIVNDPDFFVDQEGDATSTDAGYCICYIDLETMTITPITKGLYYGNFVTFAINSEGRAFALTSGGTIAAMNGNEDVKVYDIDGNLDEVLEVFDREIGLDRLKALHINDSQNPLGARKDRHARIGEGHLGTEAIRNVIYDPRLMGLPCILETPQESLAGYGDEIAMLKGEKEN